jgi:hypothetical protein
MSDNDRLLAYVDHVERTWMRLGVEPVIRRRLMLELEADLASARDGGAPVEQLTATDPVTFAVELAQAANAPLLAPPPEPTRSRVITTAILGAAAGAVFAWVFIETGPIGDLVYGTQPGLREQYAWIPLQALALLVTLAGVAGAVWVRFRATPGARTLALRTAALALAGGLVSTAPLVWYAWKTDYNTSAYALTIGAVIAAALVGAALWIGLPRRPTRPARS